LDGVYESEHLPRDGHDHKRFETYPNPNLKAWYKIYNSNDLKHDSVVEIRVCGETLVLWRNAQGKESFFDILFKCSKGTIKFIRNLLIIYPYFHSFVD
jgi:hypothetical protein